MRTAAPVGTASSAIEAGGADDLGFISDGISGITELLALPATEHAENLPRGVLQLPLSPGSRARQQRVSPHHSSVARPTSKGSSSVGRDSGVLVEEEAMNWLQELGRRSHEFTSGVRRDSRNDSRNNSRPNRRDPSEGSENR